MKQSFIRILTIAFIWLYCYDAVAQTSETRHAKVYRTNLESKYIDPDGTPLLYHTNNKNIFRGTYFEYLNNAVKATSHYRVVTPNMEVNILFRHDRNSDSFAQLTTRKGGMPVINSFRISHNHKKEITDAGLIYGLYRYGDWLELLYIKAVNGDILFKL
jgi:hypothetical protein